MSVKKLQPANLSRDQKCSELVSEINNILKKIKSGRASSIDLDICKKMTNVLSSMIKSFSDSDPFDTWVAKETVEMSKYTCKKYGHLAMNDKI